MKTINNYSKHFISNCDLPEQGETTFLTDKKVDAQLYAIFMEHSTGVPANESKTGQYETIVYKSDLPSATDICAILGKSRNTYRNHLKYLLEQGYIIDCSTYYIINTRKENSFLSIDLDTIKFLNNNVKEPVWKIYLYLGQKWKWKGSNYLFTLEELGKHIGRNINHNQETYKYIKDILNSLVDNGLIKMAQFYDGQWRRCRLVEFNGYTPKAKSKTTTQF